MLARCVFCQKSFETDRFGVQPCPHCGQHVHLADPSAPAPTQPAPQGPPPGAPPPGAYPGPMPGSVPGAAWTVGEADAPFAQRSSLGFVRSYVVTWKLACLQPAEFFRSVRTSGTGSAVLFGVIAMTLASWFQTLYGAVMGAATQGMMQEMLRHVPDDSPYHGAVAQWVSGATTIGTVAQLVAAPFVSAISLLVWAGVYHVALLVLGAASRRFEATLTVVGYASGALLVGAAPVPVLASLVGAVWFSFAAAIGFREAQRTTNGKAWTAVALPFLALCACCCAGPMLGAFFLKSMLGHGG